MSFSVEENAVFIPKKKKKKKKKSKKSPYRGRGTPPSHTFPPPPRSLRSLGFGHFAPSHITAPLRWNPGYATGGGVVAWRGTAQLIRGDTEWGIWPLTLLLYGTMESSGILPPLFSKVRSARSSATHPCKVTTPKSNTILHQSSYCTKDVSAVELTPGGRKNFSYDIFVHGSKCQFIDGINLNLTHVCVCCEIIFVFTYIALVVFVYKVKQKNNNSIKILPKMPRMWFEPTPYEWHHSATAWIGPMHRLFCIVIISC